MYTLRTDGNREEGPLTEAQVAERIHTRRLGPDSVARGPKDPGWHPLSAFPEFKGPLRQHAEMGAILNAPRRSRLAMATLSLGILCLAAIVVALVAAAQIPRLIAEATQRERRAAAIEAPAQPGVVLKEVVEGGQNPDPAQRRLERRLERAQNRVDGPGGPPPPSPDNQGNAGIKPGQGPNRAPSRASARAQAAVRPEPPKAIILTIVTSTATGLAAFVATVVCGSFALVRIRRRNANLVGGNLAWSGLGCAGAALVAAGIGTWQAMSQIPVQEVRRYAAYQGRMQAVAQLHRQALAVNNTYPSADRWCDNLKSAGNTNAPALLGTPKEGCKFGYNSRVEGRKHKEVPRDTVIFFELRKPAWNMAGGPDLIKRPGDVAERVVVVTADGRSRLIPALEVDGLRWEP